ncbi:MAG TPA: DUF3467 domain-containing protein [Terriglobales bacterium]
MANEEAVTTEPSATQATSGDMPKMLRSPEFRTVYTNFVQAGYTPFDVSLLIGESIGPDAKGNAVVEFKSRITMSPAEAKVVHKILGDLIMAYEKQFGAIQLPIGLDLPTHPKTEGV